MERTITNRKQGDLESIQIDADLMRVIVKDMKENAGDLMPLNHWHLVEKGNGVDDIAIADASIIKKYDDSFMKAFSTAEKMMDAWVGCNGLMEMSENERERYEAFFDVIDNKGFYKNIIGGANRQNIDYRNVDLSTIEQLNMLMACLYNVHNPFVLEVGAGYGRMTEAICKNMESVKYVIIDAVPGSLFFSHEYLKKELPDRKIGFYYAGDSFDMDTFDIYIVPAWHFKDMNHYAYDCCINISSMQEMGRQHIDFYIALFDAVTKLDGYIFLFNSRDYVYKGIWKYPDTWKKLAMFNTPSSWTRYYPAEIFQKSNEDYADWNNVIRAGYEYSLYEKDNLVRERNDLIHKNDELVQEKDILLREKKSMEDRIERMKEEIYKIRTK